MKHLHFIRSLLIWLLVFVPAVILSAFIVAWKLRDFEWIGIDGWYGNAKYSRVAAAQHYEFPTRFVYWREWWFYVVRNPVSNLGHTTLAIYPPPYEYTDYRILGFITVNFGYKASGTFKFRPRFVKK